MIIYHGESPFYLASYKYWGINTIHTKSVLFVSFLKVCMTRLYLYWKHSVSGFLSCTDSGFKNENNGKSSTHNKFSKPYFYIYLVLLWQMLQTMGLGSIKVSFYNLCIKMDRDSENEGTTNMQVANIGRLHYLFAIRL